MIGSIVGDVIGSVYEFNPLKSTDFPLFTSTSTYTDDTVLSMAVAKCILEKCDLVQTFKDFTRRYPGRGYGHHFLQWVNSESAEPYQSFGNGSAMRVSPVGFAFSSHQQVLAEAKRSAEVTHNHAEGIKGAQATALAIFLARKKNSKETIKNEIEMAYRYDLSRSIDRIRPNYQFDVTCQGSVPEAIIAFLESTDFEDAIRKSISLGGDADTQACITGGIAEAFYGSVPAKLIEETRLRLPDEFLSILDRFSREFNL